MELEGDFRVESKGGSSQVDRGAAHPVVALGSDAPPAPEGLHWPVVHAMGKEPQSLRRGSCNG